VKQSREDVDVVSDIPCIDLIEYLAEDKSIEDDCDVLSGVGSYTQCSGSGAVQEVAQQCHLEQELHNNIPDGNTA
jgi:hypothetical protein